MDQSIKPQKSVIEQQRIVIKNKYGENLVGILHETGSEEVIILCHGFTSNKESALSALIFLGMGGDTVLVYASKHHDVPMVINVSGCYNMEEGIKERLGERFMERIKENGCIDVMDGEGNFWCRVTEESLLERLATDMRALCLSIPKDCRVFTVHGSEDECIPVEDAFKFSKIIHNHKLHIVEGADHCYNNHQSELVEVVVNFIKESLKERLRRIKLSALSDPTKKTYQKNILPMHCNL
ncbi:uncharacterized protein LOC113347827 isoform X5 [Papaver somniferum]|uniref:uncharacterized protein LOC113347827 isoform X5 n=1 Tax=Papaver somniferum TaxID=3469 RepID=UPI000E704754|nr:uncharacterized protein LOC113347827 isoform X5 [Papaver somniferum]